MSASSLPGKVVASLSKAAAWVSIKLTAALAIGLLLIPVIGWIPPFLAPHSTAAAPVAIVRTVPVPYLDAMPSQAPTPPLSTGRETGAKILQVVRRAKAQQKEAPRKDQAKRESDSGAPTKAATDAGQHKAPADSKAAPKANSKIAPADGKATDAKATPPEPDTWSDAEVIAALRDCLHKLAPLGAELELAAWDIRGQKLWSTFVEPPWEHELDGAEVKIDVMGAVRTFSIETGPPPPR